MRTLDESSDGQAITLRVGERFTLTLAENPSTGFRWQLVADAAPLCSVAADHFEPAVHPPGRPGMHSWEFEAAQAGDARIALAYRRAWERRRAPARTFTLHVQVRA